MRRATRSTDDGTVERDDSSRTVLRVSVQHRDSSGVKLLWRPTEHTSSTDSPYVRIRALASSEPILDRFSEGVAVRLNPDGTYGGPASPEHAAGVLRRLIDDTVAGLRTATAVTPDGRTFATQALTNLRASPQLAILAVAPIDEYLALSGYVFPVDTTLTVDTTLPIAAFKTQVSATEEVRIRRDGPQGEFLRFEVTRRPRPEAMRRVIEQFATSSGVNEPNLSEHTFRLEVTALWVADLRTGLVSRFERHARAVFGGNGQESSLILETR